MNEDSLIAAIQLALKASPNNGHLWLHLGELFQKADRHKEAQAAFRSAAQCDESRLLATIALAKALRHSDEAEEAILRAESQLQKEPDATLRLWLALLLLDRLEVANARAEFQRALDADPESVANFEREQAIAFEGLFVQALERASAAAAPKGVERQLIDVNESLEEEAFDFEAAFGPPEPVLTLGDVVGLDAVKRQIKLRIIAPFQQPEIFGAFKRPAGGGLLLYGPPGCGKTYIARATAGELAAHFYPVSIHDIVDKYWGESEKAIHALFDAARRRERSVLFFDEFDSLGSKRSGSSQFWRTLVNQLLQEMDGVGSKNVNVLVIAATNEPWSVDSAFRRPGRFDRMLLVTPPDEPAREAILAQYSKSLPGSAQLNLALIAQQTPLFTGADLKALCERASEGPLERSLESGSVQPVMMKDFATALREVQSTALEWISAARNHARYANESGLYDELVAWLKSVKKW